MASSEFSSPSSYPEPLASVAPGGSLTRWQKFRLVVKVVELRLRFVALMAITGLVFAHWDSLWNRYDKWMRPTTGEHAVVSGAEYFCPMHPNVIRDESASCPICGMPLSKRKKGETEVLGEGVTARVQLAPFRIKQAGIRTALVGYSPMSETLTTVGTVELDERRRSHIASRLKGMARVETLAVNFTGVSVKAGEPLGELYSPELFQAIQELLLAKRSSRDAPRMQSALGKSVMADQIDLVKLSETKLKIWGITQGQIDEILTQGKADYKLPIIAPIGGVVVRKNVVQGQYVSEGQAMFEVADLSTVWVKAQVFEDQIGLIREGQSVEAVVESAPGRVFTGKVAFIQPQVDPATRTVEVRYDLENRDGQLRPGMFATVSLKTLMSRTPMFQGQVARIRAEGGDGLAQTKCPVTHAKLGSMGSPVSVDLLGRKVWACCEACTPKMKANPAKYLVQLDPPPAEGVLSVPESAVIDTGVDKIVYVETDTGVFEGRKVVLGPRSGDHFSVLEGLVPGENVAAAGAFLVDAESRLNPATRGQAGVPQHDHAPSSPIPKPEQDRVKPPRSASRVEVPIRR